MTNIELVLNMLAEVTTTVISKLKEPTCNKQTAKPSASSPQSYSAPLPKDSARSLPRRAVTATGRASGSFRAERLRQASRRKKRLSAKSARSLRRKSALEKKSRTLNGTTRTFTLACNALNAPWSPAAWTCWRRKARLGLERTTCALSNGFRRTRRFWTRWPRPCSPRLLVLQTIFCGAIICLCKTF